MAEAQIVQRQTSAISTLRDLLEKSKAKFQDVIPKHLSADRLVRVAIVACSRTPKLLLCTPTSVLNSVMQAAQLGLEPGGPLGDAYLVPYKDTCQLIVGYRGLISLARRSGQIESLEAHVVHAKDRFVCKYGLTPVLEHEPDWSENPGPAVAVYAVAKLKDGGTQSEVMTKAQIDAIRGRSRASGDGPWVSDYDEMARKTVVRRLCKYLPLSVELADALEEDARAEFGSTSDVIEIPATVETQEIPTTTTQKLKWKLAAKAKPYRPDPPEMVAETNQILDDLNPGCRTERKPDLKADPPKASAPSSDNRSRNARIAAIREEAKEKHGDRFADAWSDACRECANNRPSTNWTDKEILAVTDYLSNWRFLRVEDATSPGVDTDAAAILTGEREPGSDDD